MVHLDLSKTEVGPFSWQYTEKETILYNLGVGCRWNEQRYVFEGHSDFAPLPTLAVIPPYHDVLASVPLQDVLPKYNPVCPLPAQLDDRGPAALLSQLL